jgi:hypothetical protein
VIAQNPTDTTVLKANWPGSVSPLSTAGLYGYRWQRNGAALAGRGWARTVYGPVTLADHNCRFRCVVTNSLGSATSAEAVLTVTRTRRPHALGCAQSSQTSVEVTFSEPVLPATALNLVNFALTGGVQLTAVSPGLTRITVLATSAMTYGLTYTLTVNRVADLAGTPNVIAPNSQAVFVASEFTPSDIGSPTLAGGTRSVPGGVEVTGAGKTIGGTSDQFQFGWQERSGDFDVQARLEDVTITDAFLQAGLMARETLDGNARFAAAFASSPQRGSYFASRATVGGKDSTAAPRNGFPVNYPHTWLRLQRVGGALTGYASLDGRVWTQLGSVTLTGLPASLYVGSPSAATMRSSWPRHGSVTSGSTSTASGMVTRIKEPVGPSSRATGMIFIETCTIPHRGLMGETSSLLNCTMHGRCSRT